MSSLGMKAARGVSGATFVLLWLVSGGLRHPLALPAVDGTHKERETTLEGLTTRERGNLWAGRQPWADRAVLWIV